MDFLDRLGELMAQEGISRRGLSRATGIPYTTIMGFYDKGYSNIKLGTLRKLAEYFGVSLDYLVGNDMEEENARDALPDGYSTLSKRGQDIVDSVLEGLLEYEREDGERNVEYMREYLTPAAAGIVSPAEGEDFVLIPKGPNVPRGADFAVRIDGDSMEPYIRDGSRVYVSRTPELMNGDVGIFFVEGDIRCKQFCADGEGNTYLLSLNRERSDADVIISTGSDKAVYCFGKVLLRRRPPLP